VQRPPYLPDFRSPPLDEVVLGVQFAPVPGYLSIHAGHVWDLFREEFPHVQEHPPLAPTFETFGLPQAGQISFGITTTVPHSRFWFLSKGKDELIQFQNDRILHNWRKIGDRANKYPRFEVIIEKFKKELYTLQDYFKQFKSAELTANQCEVSYVNKIQVSLDPNPQHWLRYLCPNDIKMDDFSMVFRRVIFGEDGKPRGRLFCEASSVGDAKGQRVIVLSLTVKGAPATPDIPGALDFLRRGREIIVTTFADVTTDSAHKEWGRL
jgi:uncharacterized protein (TIGR04255 family)